MGGKGSGWFAYNGHIKGSQGGSVEKETFLTESSIKGNDLDLFDLKKLDLKAYVKDGYVTTNPNSTSSQFKVGKVIQKYGDYVLHEDNEHYSITNLKTQKRISTSFSHYDTDNNPSKGEKELKKKWSALFWKDFNGSVHT